MVEEFDQLDRDWTQGWLDWIYGYQYNRGVLDDRTRVLVIIGECCVSSALVQLPNHIRTALRVGATKEEGARGDPPVGDLRRDAQDDRGDEGHRDLMKDLGLIELEQPSFRGDARE